MPVRLRDAELLGARARAAIAPSDRPLALREACEAARVRVLSRALTIGRHRRTAMLVPTREGFNALVDSLVWQRASARPNGRRRLRFVLAHELGHTFFYRPGRPPTRNQRPDRLEERFCHRFATSLLVPLAAARRAPLDSQGLHGLAARFDVSLAVSAWAATRAHPDVSIVWLRHSPHPHRGGAETMRVQWAAGSRFIPRGESLKSDLASLAPGDTARTAERLRLGGRHHHVDLAAWRFASAMLLVMHHRAEETSPHTPDVSSTQLALFA